MKKWTATDYFLEGGIEMNKLVIVIRQGIPEIIQNGTLDVEVIDLDNIEAGYADSWDSNKIDEFQNWAKGLPKDEIDDLVKELKK
jgi:hypothetical protein